jgi:hypothetical protein
MTFDIFSIENILISLDTKLFGTNFIQNVYNNTDNLMNSQYRNYLEKVIDESLNKTPECQNMLLQDIGLPLNTIQEDYNISIFTSQFLSEIQNYINKYLLDVIKENKKFSFEYNFKVFSSFEKLLVYFLYIHREIIVLVNEKLNVGIYSRYRVLIELYSIFLFFIKHQDCIIRFNDHQFLRTYLLNKKWNMPNNKTDEEKYHNIKRIYKEEFSAFKQSYGWAGKYIKYHGSAKEIIDIAFDDINERKYFHKEYEYLSEYSHVSSFVTNNIDKFNINEIRRTLIRSDELGIYFVQIFLKLILHDTSFKDKPIAYLMPLLNILHLRLKIV